MFEWLVWYGHFDHIDSLTKWLSVRLRSKRLWVWLLLQSLNLQISRLFWTRSSLAPWKLDSQLKRMWHDKVIHLISLFTLYWKTITTSFLKVNFLELQRMQMLPQLIKNTSKRENKLQICEQFVKRFPAVRKVHVWWNGRIDDILSKYQYVIRKSL